MLLTGKSITQERISWFSKDLYDQAPVILTDIGGMEAERFLLRHYRLTVKVVARTEPIKLRRAFMTTGYWFIKGNRNDPAPFFYIPHTNKSAKRGQPLAVSCQQGEQNYFIAKSDKLKYSHRSVR